MTRPSRELSLQQCYEALGLEAGADLEELKSAYRRRAFELHPDLHPENPQAGREFQVVNEAYVLLARILPPGQKRPTPEEKTSGNAGSKRPEQARENSSDAEADDTTRKQHGEARHDRGAAERTRRTAHAAYAKGEDLLRDLLDDPFARRVFEDIYAQMQDTQEPPPPPPGSNPDEHASQAHAESVWEERFKPDFRRGIGKAVKNWMRRRIDEEQTFHLPPSVLRPGARIRLQIRRGVSDEVSSVEIKLPWDYTEGKPVCLKGMGRRIGRWRGDLYLTLVAKQ